MADRRFVENGQSGRLPRSYRPTKSLPFELREHINIYFGEGLHYQAVTLLTTLLTSGTPVPDSPAFLPSPAHLAFCSTLATHPTFTTRAKTPDRAQICPISLNLLRLTSILVGPIAACFNKAFEFKHFDAGSRHGGVRRTGPTGGTLTDDGNQGGGLELLELELAGSGSLWARAEDFWAVVGWAFNCSVVHGKRWEVWEGWLEAMVAILEQDFTDRLDVDMDLEGSLIFAYVDRGSGGYARNRRIMRAVFADGSPRSMNEFREVYKDEPKELKKDKDGKIKKRQVEVNIEKDVFGDYYRQNESDESEDEADLANGDLKDRPRPRRGRSKPRSQPASKSNSRPSSRAGLNPHSPFLADSGDQSDPSTPPLGPMSSLQLRLRILLLLTSVATHLPYSFLDVSALNNLITEHIRPLPVPMFSLLILPSGISPSLPVSSLRNLLHSYISTAVAPPSSISPLTQSTLETEYLPYDATTTTLADNTKLSLILESLLRDLARDGKLQRTESLVNAVDEGISSRGYRVQSGSGRAGSKKGPADDYENGFNWFSESGERMRWVVDDL